MQYDLLLKGGHVMDPSQGFDGPADVAFAEGRVVAVAPALSARESREVVDVSRKIVTPGLLDIHGHFFYRCHFYSAEPDIVCLPCGVTTAVDGGSAGWVNFDGLRHYIMERCQTRLLAFLNLSSVGLATIASGVGELHDFRLARAEETARCLSDNRDLLLGLKVRLADNGTGPENARPALEMVRAIADETGTKLMIHVSGTPLPLKEVFPFLTSGDIVTHIFNGKENNILDSGGKVRPEVWDATQRGVILDTGCFQTHFDSFVSRVAIQQGLWPHTLSTDIVNLPHAFNLLDVMSIFLELGLPWEEVIASVTSRAASAIGKSTELGTLRVGAEGDAAVLELAEGDFGYEDATGNMVRCSRRFVSVLTVKGGRHWRPPHL